MKEPFEPVEASSAGVYRLTEGPHAHTHTYHKYCPWSPDGSKIIFFEYEKTRKEGNVCLMDFASGSSEVIGTSTWWNGHEVANQMWIGNSDRVLYRSARLDGDHQEWKIFDLAAGRERVLRIPAHIGDAGDDLLVGELTLGRVFPGDEIRDRDQDGLISINADTGEIDILCSTQRVLKNHPHREQIKSLHVFVKQQLLHRRLRKVAFNFANSIWAKWAGGSETKVGDLHAFDLDTDELTWVGAIGHHPIWHPTEPWLLSFSDDEQDRRRLTFDKLQPDGSVRREFLEYFSSSGHPSVDPTGRYVVLDSYDVRPGFTTLDLFDLVEQRTHTLAQWKNMTQTYPYQQLKRSSNETVVDFMWRSSYGPDKKYIVQAHPAWDRTGRFVAFNSDASGISQVHVVDLNELGLTRTTTVKGA